MCMVFFMYTKFFMCITVSMHAHLEKNCQYACAECMCLLVSASAASVCVCVCVCARACVCVCVCVSTRTRGRVWVFEIFDMNALNMYLPH